MILSGRRILNTINVFLNSLSNVQILTFFVLGNGTQYLYLVFARTQAEDLVFLFGWGKNSCETPLLGSVFPFNHLQGDKALL